MTIFNEHDPSMRGPGDDPDDQLNRELLLKFLGEADEAGAASLGDTAVTSFEEHLRQVGTSLDDPHFELTLEVSRAMLDAVRKRAGELEEEPVDSLQTMNDVGGDEVSQPRRSGRQSHLWKGLNQR